MHPQVAARPCSDCRRWLYHDKPGDFGRRVERQGLPVARPAGTNPPCSYCPKQPSGVPERERCPETAVELSDKNFLAYRHYWECSAVGSFPDDDAVRRNAGVIARVEKDVAAVQQQLGLFALTRRE